MTPKSGFFLMLLIASCSLYAQGRFEGKLVLSPSDDGRTMKIMERFSYTDWDGNKLTAEP